jgi:CRP-like cAMP-binding protein
VRKPRAGYDCRVDALTFLQTQAPLFSGSSAEVLDSLAAASELRSFKAGQTILFKGATVDALHVVATGKALVTGKTGAGAAAVLAALGPGDAFGEASIVDSTVSGATVKAGEQGAMILMIPQDAFRRALSQDEAFSSRVRALIASRRPSSR